MSNMYVELCCFAQLPYTTPGLWYDLCCTIGISLDECVDIDSVYVLRLGIYVHNNRTIVTILSTYYRNVTVVFHIPHPPPLARFKIH